MSIPGASAPAGGHNAPWTGIACIVAGMFMIVSNDVAIKWISGDYAIHQIMLTRALVAIPVTLVILSFDGGLAGLGTRRPWLHLLRGLLMAISNLCFFLGLAALPLVDVMTLVFIAPLLITALSVPLLGERVDFRRWIAVVVGLAGVVVMTRPGDGMVQLRASTLALYMQLSFLAVSAGFGLAVGDGRFAGGDDASIEFLLRAWRWPSLFHAGLIVFAGICIAIGGYLMAQAYRLAPANVVAPFEYSALPWGVLFGFLVWGDLPDAVGLAGILLIVGSGLFVLYREHVKGPRRRPGLTPRSLR
jgi:drug/metabolite transporter (DMT)-like permease